jgi:hypothetical protein
MAVASGGGTTTKITLHPSSSFPAASGKAVSKVKGSERELQVEVEHIKSLAGKHVRVFVNGSLFASPLVSSLGAASVDRSTENGQSVPRIHAGSTVRVRTTGGTLIVSGTF